MQCANCQRSDVKFQCSCSHVGYCNTQCQSADYSRHRLMLHVFAPAQQLVLREYQRLVDENREHIVVFTEKIDFLRIDGTFDMTFIDPDMRHAKVRRFEFNKRHMEDLLEFIRNTNIVSILESVPVNTQQRVELLKPWLWTNHDSAGLREAHAFLRLPLKFTLLLLYPNSLRPVTDMPKFWNLYQVPAEDRQILPDAKALWTVPTPDTKTGFLYMPDEMGIVRDRVYSIPILRYVEGMRHSLYYGHIDPPADKCGTFFYYDPASAANLLTSNTLIATNKTNAMMQLGISLTAVHRAYVNNKAFGDLYDTGDILLLAEKLLHLRGDDLITYSREYLKNDVFYRIVKLLYEQTPENAIYVAEFYAFEDVLDKLLCEAANEQDIEAVVLLRMIGGNRLVTEVMYTGGYTEAFSNVWIRE